MSGETLIAWGFKPGKWFKDAINAADKLASENHFRNATVHDEAAMIDLVQPIGCIMAGHDGTDWKAIRKAKKEKALGQANETSGNTSAG